MKKTPNTAKILANAARKAARDQELRTGIRPRAVVFADRKRQQDKRACRGKVTI